MLLHCTIIAKARRRILSAVFLFAAFIAGAQQYNFLKYSVRDGLAEAKVSCVFQDKEGYLWIGTEAGASRFDGTEFENFDATNGLPGNMVTAISENEQGILLATDSGVAVYNKGKFSLSAFPASEKGRTISAIAKNEEGVVILATDKGVLSFVKGKFNRIITSTPIDALQVSCAYFDSKNKLWIGTKENGLWRLTENNKVFTNENFPDQDKLANDHVRGVTELEDGEIWIATSNDGLFSFDGNVVNKLILPEKIRTDNFSCIHKDMFGDIWLGTWGSGVIHYTKSAFKIYNKQNGLDDDIVTCITSDRQGNTWFGTFSEGLVFFYGDKFTA
ncbi:MAG TPA: two-component regulator propeller domain-containing protein, partial [Bacteroidia bacterium]|nr:two-component regulator propeller domain-containing protein [Bacteroidia bacterium]